MNELQQQVITLVQAAMSGDKQAQQQIDTIMSAAQQGDQEAVQLAQIIQKVAQELAQVQQSKVQQVQEARFGAKLNYIKQLKGLCPDGYEMQYFKKGGQLCKKCVAKQRKMEEGGQAPKDSVDAFKCGRKTKKVEKAQNGTKSQKKQVTLKSDKYEDNGDSNVRTRKWSDGTTSKRYRDETGTTKYVGRKGEVGYDGEFSSAKEQAKADSLRRADWTKKTAPSFQDGKKLPKKTEVRGPITREIVYTGREDIDPVTGYKLGNDTTYIVGGSKIPNNYTGLIRGLEQAAIEGQTQNAINKIKQRGKKPTFPLSIQGVYSVPMSELIQNRNIYEDIENEFNSYRGPSYINWGNKGKRSGRDIESER